MEATMKKSGASSARPKASRQASTSKIRTSYDIGYARGWDDAYGIPNTLGAKTAAAYGYGKGMRNRQRTDKYIKQYNRQGKK